jgi:amino acid transporter
MNIRRIIVGEPLPTKEAIHQRLGKVKALAVFSSDALSSSAYATEAILLVLLGAGIAALGGSMWVALGIAALMIVVAFSYYQTIHAYPNGGGAYIVSKDNLGALPGLIAAAALLIDYILTVAVSVSAGVAALTSAFPAFIPFRVEVALLIVAFITVINLRGVKESGTVFAIPTYAFIVGMLFMIAVGVVNVLAGNVVPVPRPNIEEALKEVHAVEGLTLFLIFRAFAAGCTALTGIEAISNGIPAFKPPESRNAGITLIVMVALLCTMFVGITFLANQYQVVAVPHADTTVLAQIARAVVGDGVLFYYMQIATLLILSLAANTAYADFPRLASLIARDRYLPRQLTNLGDRLVFSNGIISLAVLSSILIILFGAREHNLLPLYAVGVFLSFTLSQSGMVVHWLKERKLPHFKPDLTWRFHIGLNAVGAVATFIVLIILMVTKFAEGAWLVIVAIPILVWLFVRVQEHYKGVAASLTLDGLKPGPFVERFAATYSDRIHTRMVVLMNSLNRASLQALEYALRLSDNVRVCAIEVEPDGVKRLKERWEEWQLHVPLDIVESPYREIGKPLVDYLHALDEESTEKIPTVVVLPEFVVSKWWERFLHNQTTVAIRSALYHDQIKRGRGRPVIDVPYRIGDTLYEPIAMDATRRGGTGKLPPVPTTPEATPSSSSQTQS